MQASQWSGAPPARVDAKGFASAAAPHLHPNSARIIPKLVVNSPKQITSPPLLGCGSKNDKKKRKHTTQRPVPADGLATLGVFIIGAAEEMVSVSIAQPKEKVRIIRITRVLVGRAGLTKTNTPGTPRDITHATSHKPVPALPSTNGSRVITTIRTCRRATSASSPAAA